METYWIALLVIWMVGIVVLCVYLRPKSNWRNRLAFNDNFILGGICALWPIVLVFILVVVARAKYQDYKRKHGDIWD